MVTAVSPSTATHPIASLRGRLEALGARFAGRLLTSDDVGYDRARRTSSILSDRRPLAIVRAADATDVAHRDRRYLLGIIALWLDAAEDGDPHRAWTESLWRPVRHEGRGAYVNFLGDEGGDRVREAYPAEAYARL